MYKKNKFPLDGVVRHNTLQILFILFSLFTIHFSLFAKEALPLLEENNNSFENRDDFYIPSQSSVYAIAISRDGKTIVSGSLDDTIKIWDAKSGVMLRSLEGHKGSVNSVAISKDGNTIVSGSSDNSIRIWDTKSGAMLRSLEGHKSYVNSVAISEDGNTIVSGSNDGSIKIWDAKSGAMLRSLEGHKYSVNSVAISEDGNTIVSGSDDSSIKIWDTKSGVMLKSLEGHKGDVNSVAISKDGNTIVSGSGDKSIKIWDTKSGAMLRSLEGHKDSVRSVAISEDGKSIVSGSWDKSIKIWDAKSGAMLRSLEGHKSYVYSVAISEDSKTIVSGSDDNSIKIWDTKSGAILRSLEGHKGDVNSVAISKDGKTIVSGSKDGSIKEWSVDNKAWKREFVGGVGGAWVVFVRDASGNYFLRGDNGTMLYKKEGTRVVPVYPKLAKEDKVLLSNSDNGVDTINEQNYTYNIRVKNENSRDAYWVKSSYRDEYCVVKEQMITVLKANKEQNLTLTFNCSLPRENPKPITHKINLTLETATGSKFEIPVSVSIRYADINVTKAEVSEDGKNLNIELKNIGDTNLTNAKIKLFKPFEADIQDLSFLDVNQIKKLSYVLPIGEDNKTIKLEENATLSLNLFVPNIKLEKENPNAEVEPSAVWHIKDVKIVLNKMAWYFYLLWAVAMILLVIAIYLFKHYGNSLVRELSKTPKSLLTLSPNLLEKAKERLSRIERFETLLKTLDISKGKFEESQNFVTNHPI